MNTIRNNLHDKPDSVLSELNECFKIVSATLLPSERGVYITDNKVQCRLVVESNMPKEVNCKASISVESCKDEKSEKRTPSKSHKTDLSVSSVSTQNSPRKQVVDNTECQEVSLVDR